MKQYGRTIYLKDDPKMIERYLEHHRAIWPEVERGLKSIGIERMLIFMLGRQLFMFMETTDAFDPERDFPRYEASNPRNREWQGADGLDAGAGAGRAAGRMVGRDETGLHALKAHDRFQFGLTNLSVMRSLSPIARYLSRSLSPCRNVGGRFHTG